jgi:ADP-heptose:LPS heptosyltransferase
MNILIIKPDHIGDYIVFRNFIEEIRNIKNYKNCKITCLLNQRVKDIAIFLDKKIVDEFIFIELEKYIIGDWYYHRKNQELNVSYDIVINAMLAHFDKVEETIANLNSNKKYLLYEKMYDQKEYFMKTYSNNYSQIINVSDILFEYDKFKTSFFKIFNQKMASISPKIKLKNIEKYKISYDFDYILFFIGSDSDYRKWNIYKYSKLIKFIIDCTPYHVVLTGANLEYDDSMIIEQNVQNNKFHNLVSQTSLIDMLYLLDKSKIVISNETGTAHMSVALEKYTLVVSNGNHFGKFTPYPKEYTDKYYSIYPFDINNKDDFNFYLKKYYTNSKLDINKISYKKVENKLKEIFSILNIRIENNSQSSKTHYPSLSFSQLKLNYEFSVSFGKLVESIFLLKKSNNKFLLYGYGTIGKYIEYILKEQIVGVVDKNMENSFELFSLKNYDKILISVLGREDIIEEDLISNYKISQDKIEKFKIIRTKYNVRTK